MQEAVAANEDRSAEHPAARVPAPRADPVLASTRVSRDEARVRARILAARAGAIEGGAIGILAFSSIRGALLPIVLLVGVGMLSASIATTRVRSLSPAGRPYRVGDLVAKSLFVSTIALMVGMAFFCGIRGLV